jgi:Recombination endonuclease VII
VCNLCKRREVIPPNRRCQVCKDAALPLADQIEAARLRRRDISETIPVNRADGANGGTVRWCAGCGHWLAWAHFSKGASRCRGCAGLDRLGGRASIYGIDAEIYERMREASNGRCWICGGQPRTQQLAVDHNHITGQVRGLLCGGGPGSKRGCNHVLLPAAGHSPYLLRRAADYLEGKLPEQNVIPRMD